MVELKWSRIRKNQYGTCMQLEGTGPTPGWITWYGRLMHYKSGVYWEDFSLERKRTKLPDMTLEEAKAAMEAKVYLEG